VERRRKERDELNVAGVLGSGQLAERRYVRDVDDVREENDDWFPGHIEVPTRRRGRGRCRENVIMTPDTARRVHRRLHRLRETGDGRTVIRAVIDRLVRTVNCADRTRRAVWIDDQVQRRQRSCGLQVKRRADRSQEKDHVAVSVVVSWLQDALPELHFAAGKRIGCESR